MLVIGGMTPVMMMQRIELIGLVERLTQLGYLQWFAAFSLKAYNETAAERPVATEVPELA